ncbi:MAG: peptide chain release factor aRF-1 [Candidatus Aenigmatarchaeota archaeon]
MTEDTLARKRLAGLIKRLSAVRGRHTELITIYVPAGMQLHLIAAQVANEQGTAVNIKSKAVRKNVLSALDKIFRHLKLYKKPPENGLAIFCGNVSEKEGESDIELWAIEPPEKLNQRLYRCDQEFVLEPLMHLTREKEIYGLIVIDKSDADIGLLSGRRVESLKHIESLVPGKTKKGGWSQARYQRVREGLLNDHLKKAGQLATAYFRDMKDLRGIIIGGPGPIKDMFYKEDHLPTDIKAKVLGVVDTSYTELFGLQETVVRAEDILAEASITRERKLLERFFGELAKDSGLAVYGVRETVNALEMGAVEILLISEEFDWISGKFQCPSCGKAFERIIKRNSKDGVKCPSCGALSDAAEEAEADATEKLTEFAGSVGTRVEIVSTDSREGDQLHEMGGIAGILRYSIK